MSRLIFTATALTRLWFSLHCFIHVCILKILKAEATHLSFQITSLPVVSTVPSLQAIRYCTPAPSAYRLWLSGGKTASACQREVSLVLSISSGVDKKTDGTGEVRGPCYGWQVCLFGLSLISCFPPSTPCTDSAFSLTWKWPRRGGSRPLFTESQHQPLHSPLRSTQNTRGDCGRLYHRSDMSNNWLICTHMVELS